MITFEEFQQKEIRRTGDIAEIIFDYFGDKPIRLIGFYCSSDLSDFEILEQGWDYYERLVAAVKAA
jgi:hypothetical protein